MYITTFCDIMTGLLDRSVIYTTYVITCFKITKNIYEEGKHAQIIYRRCTAISEGHHKNKEVY